MSSARLREMGSPSPVPPCRRATEGSAWAKGWKIRSIRSGGIPSPESSTVQTSWPSRASSSRTTCPRGVNFTALESRFPRICRTRFGSPRTAEGTPSRTRTTTERPFSDARWAKARPVSRVSRPGA